MMWNTWSCFVAVQLLSHVQLFVTPWTAAWQASLSLTDCQSLLKSCPLSQWRHPTISSSVTPFSSCLQPFPTSGAFPMSLGSLKSFLWYASQLSVARILCFHILSLLRALGGNDCSLMAAKWQVFFPLRTPSGLTSSPCLLAIIVCDCDILVY